MSPGTLISIFLVKRVKTYYWFDRNSGKLNIVVGRGNSDSHGGSLKGGTLKVQVICWRVE
jgi:hypothetical protein